jgi:CBS domain-containing protein
MRTKISVCNEHESIRSIALKMRDENVGFLPVRDESGRITGAVTDRDVAIRLCAEGRDPDGTRVEEIMTREVYFCLPTDPIKEAEELMARRRVQRVMIMDNSGALVGVVSLSDLGSKEWGWRVARTMRQVSAREKLHSQ